MRVGHHLGVRMNEPITATPRARSAPPLDLWMKPPPARAASSPLALSRANDQRAITRAHVPISNFDVSKFENRASCVTLLTIDTWVEVISLLHFLYAITAVSRRAGDWTKKPAFGKANIGSHPLT